MNVPCGGGGRSPREPLAGKGREGGAAEGGADGGDAGWRGSSAHRLRAEGRKMEARLGGTPSAFLPVPSRSFSSAILVRNLSPGRCPWQPCGAREQGAPLRAPSSARGPLGFPPGNRGPRSLGRGVSFIRTVPEPALASR